MTTGAALVLLAAGRGTRTGSPTPKQFIADSSGRTVLEATALRALTATAWDQVIVVAPEGARDSAAKALRKAGCESAVVVAGGTGRLGSIARGLTAVDRPICVIHDGTRPLAPVRLFGEVLSLVVGGDVDAAWPAATPANTVLDVSGPVPMPVRSSNLRAVSTPIAVRTDLARAALRSAGDIDGALVPMLIDVGCRWSAIDDSPLNFKVTTEEDLASALQLMELGLSSS